MFSPKAGLAALALAATVGLSGCTDGYGYSGVSLGYSSGGYGGYYDGDYYDAAYYGGGYGYGGYGGYGWYGNYYYPGTGYYVYDRDRRPYRWNDRQRRYWEGRRNYRGDGRGIRNNWRNFDRGRGDGNRGDNWRGRWGGRGAAPAAPGRAYRGGQVTRPQSQPGRGNFGRFFRQENRGGGGGRQQGGRPGRRN